VRLDPFLAFAPLRANIDITGDLSHGCWNDVQACSRITFTQANDDGFNRQKRAQYHSYNSAVMQASRMWHTAIDKQVLGGKSGECVQHYDEVSFKDTMTSTGDFRRIDEGVFRGSTENSQKQFDLLQVIGTKQTPPWTTVSEGTLPRCAVDLVVTKKLSEQES
jgi:hypothetical protein